MIMHHTRTGRGKPLLLVHGLGGSSRSWNTISSALAQSREVIALDLPGHGQTPEEIDSGTFDGLARSLDAWLRSEGLTEFDMVGSSLGARLVLEMARRGHAGAVVALDPGGFWQGWERTFFRTTLIPSIGLVRALRPALPAIVRNVAGRTALMIQLSAKPWGPRAHTRFARTEVVRGHGHVRRACRRSRYRLKSAGLCGHAGTGGNRLGAKRSSVPAAAGKPRDRCLPQSYASLV